MSDTLLPPPVALVTGAGSGIGRATTLRLVADGARVIALDVNEEGLRETASLAGSPEAVRTLLADVTDEDAPPRAVGLALQCFGALDWLVNNAGIGASKPVRGTGDAEFERFLSVNLTSVFRFSREALPHLRPGRGAIVHVASVYGLVGFPGFSSYSASKAAVIGLTRQMAADYGPMGIRVNAVAPGIIETGLTRERLRSSERIRRLMVGMTPLPRHGQPEDVAAAIRFLLSTEAGFINGHVLAVDGGWSVTKHSIEVP